MPLWIAIAASLYLGQTQDTPPSPPEDPGIRDPAAAALQDSYEQAQDTVDGYRPPEGYTVQVPENPYTAAGAVVPLLPNGEPPVTAGEVANQEAAAPIAPPVIREPATGGSGSTDASANPSDAEAATGTDTGQSPASSGYGAQADTSAQTSSEATAPADVTDTTPDGSAVPTDTSAQAPNGATAPASNPGQTSNGATEQSGAPQATSSAPSVAAQESATTQAAGTGGSGAAQVSATGQVAGTGGSGAAQGSSAPHANGASTGTAASGQNSASQDLNAAGFGGATVVEPSQPGAPTASSATQQENAPATQDEVERLRARVNELEQDVAQRDAQAQARTGAVQSQVDTYEQRAYSDERARQGRLARIQSAGQWMVAADQALEQGELDVGNALDVADQSFASVRESASGAGQGLVVVHSERARALIQTARDAAERQDVYAARLALQSAGYELAQARAASLDRPGSSNTFLER
ncbi:hypothetical protein DRW03_02005 [Corallococcus sp. H22C18031201]|nr:hypothetical protein DRW03_02005 [Corallococcus sp. H22C18031201]